MVKAMNDARKTWDAAILGWLRDDPNAAKEAQLLAASLDCMVEDAAEILATLGSWLAKEEARR